jgi:hypothetical protein
VRTLVVLAFNIRIVVGGESAMSVFVMRVLILRAFVANAAFLGVYTVRAFIVGAVSLVTPVL